MQVESTFSKPPLSVNHFYHTTFKLIHLEEFKKLFLLLKEYIERQKEDMTLSTVENLTKIVSALVVGSVMLLLGSIALFLAAIALAIYISEYTGSLITGFAATAGIVLVLMLVFWLLRNWWSVQPIARAMIGVFFPQSPSQPQKKDNVA